MSALLYVLFFVLVIATGVAYSAATDSFGGFWARDVCSDLAPMCDYPWGLVAATAATGVALVLTRMGRA